MVAQILLHADAYFRWFDSGDVQSTAHALQICEVARKTPSIQHWCPTQEARIWTGVQKQGLIPDNLVVRLSGIKIGTRRRSRQFPTSMTKVATKKEWATLTNDEVHHCPGPLQDEKCGSCRACWDKTIETVAYRQH